MQLFDNKVTEADLDSYLAIADTFVHETTPANLRAVVGERLSDAQLREYTATVTRPSAIPAFRAYVLQSINGSSSASIQMFRGLAAALRSRVLAAPLTRSATLVTDMTPAQRAQMLLAWRDSPLEVKNRLFSLFARLTMAAFTFTAPESHFRAMDYPVRELRRTLAEDYEADPFEYTFREPPMAPNAEMHMAGVDVVVIGSGSGAGVAAHTMARAGLKCLVLERGKYFRPADLAFDDASGYRELYEGGGALTTENSQLLILAGATFGGGSTVNWSACLKTPFSARKEWHDAHGVGFVGTDTYDGHLDYVFRQMGASTEHVEHSFANEHLLAGCKRLGYSCKPIEQNNGRHKSHACGFCHLGCKWGVKQGSLALWLRDAAEHGTEFMDQVEVSRIVRDRRNVAVALQCVNRRNGARFTIKGPRRFVVCGGALQTPVLLQKSGFANKHIGRNLKLHPITSVLACWDDRKTDPFNHSIMTSICLEAADLDGRGHGTRIETLLHTPSIEACFLPWESSDQIRRDLLKYQSTTAYIMLCRDTSSGSVTYDRHKPDTLAVDYAVNKTDRHHIATAILYTMDFVYVEGAIEIIHPYWRAGRFTSTKPKDQRDVNDADYQAFRKKCESLGLSAYGVAYGSAHQMSSCRMSGKGPGDGACDTRGRLYECDNVYVADASILPTASGANPMVSTMAMAREVALGICREAARSKI